MESKTFCNEYFQGFHLKNIFGSGELNKDSVTEKISAIASDGKNYMTQFYNLDAVISVGYRVNSIRDTQFHQWATIVLREFAIRVYVLDKKFIISIAGRFETCPYNHEND